MDPGAGGLGDGGLGWWPWLIFAGGGGLIAGMTADIRVVQEPAGICKPPRSGVVENGQDEKSKRVGWETLLPALR